MEIKFNINDTVKTNAGTEGKITSINLWARCRAIKYGMAKRQFGIMKCN